MEVKTVSEVHVMQAGACDATDTLRCHDRFGYPGLHETGEWSLCLEAPLRTSLSDCIADVYEYEGLRH